MCRCFGEYLLTQIIYDLKSKDKNFLLIQNGCYSQSFTSTRMNATDVQFSTTFTTINTAVQNSILFWRPSLNLNSLLEHNVRLFINSIIFGSTSCLSNDNTVKWCARESNTESARVFGECLETFIRSNKPMGYSVYTQLALWYIK